MRNTDMSPATTGIQGCEHRLGLHRRVITGWIAMLVILFLVQAGESRAQGSFREELIPVLGVTMEESPVGEVAYLVLSFEERTDHGGLAVQFMRSPGRFSRMAQTAVEEAIYRAAHALGLSPDSWTVMLALPYPGLTMYGDSCSAMVALSVAALAKGERIPPDRVITGTVTPDGRIGAVGAVSLKVAAANEAHLHRVLVSDEQDEMESDWETPFLMQISPVGTVVQAYLALTDLRSLP